MARRSVEMHHTVSHTQPPPSPKDFEYSDWGSYKVISFLGESISLGISRTMKTADENILFRESTDENSLSSEQLEKILIDDKTRIRSRKENP